MFLSNHATPTLWTDQFQPCAYGLIYRIFILNFRCKKKSYLNLNWEWNVNDAYLCTGKARNVEGTVFVAKTNDMQISGLCVSSIDWQFLKLKLLGNNEISHMSRQY